MSSGRLDSDMMDIRHGVGITDLQSTHAHLEYLQLHQILSKEPPPFLKNASEFA